MTNEMNKTSDDIKKLIERLRATYFEVRDFSLHDVRDAADALEAMAEKLQRETKAAGYWMERFCASENERDRLKDEVERLRNEKVAGQDTAKPEAIERSTPATEPAPAVASTPRHTRPYLTPLSAEAQQHRKPLSPVELVGALQDMPKIQIQAHPERFARPPIKFTEVKE